MSSGSSYSYYSFKNFNVSSYTGTINYISDVSNRVGTAISNPLLKQADINATVTVPIHRVNNRGKIGTGTLMNLSAKLNENIDASVNYTGFPITIPSTNTAGNVTIETNSIEYIVNMYNNDNAGKPVLFDLDKSILKPEGKQKKI